MECLIDIGAECNVIGQKDATLMGLEWTRGSSVRLIGFASTSASILGEWVRNFSLGGNIYRRVNFIVVAHEMKPIVGMPTLKDFGVVVNCRDKCLEHAFSNQKIADCQLVDMYLN